MSIYNKVKWVLGIFMVFFLIVGTNLIDKENFTRVKDSVVTIYEDRFIAQGLLFDLLVLIQEKEIADASSDSAFFDQRNGAVNKEIDGLIARYLTTKLTDQEERVFNEFRVNLDKLYKLENSNENGQLNSGSDYDDQIQLIKENLQELSGIQIAEGRHQSLLSQEAIKAVELFTQIEIYLLIFLAVLVQIIVIYKPKKE